MIMVNDMEVIGNIVTMELVVIYSPIKFCILNTCFPSCLITRAENRGRVGVCNFETTDRVMLFTEPDKIGSLHRNQCQTLYTIILILSHPYHIPYLTLTLRCWFVRIGKQLFYLAC